MAGQIRLMLETIIRERSKGNPTVALTTRTKIVLKGLNPDRYNGTSDDDPKIIARVRAVAAELGVAL